MDESKVSPEVKKNFETFWKPKLLKTDGGNVIDADKVKNHFYDYFNTLERMRKIYKNLIDPKMVTVKIEEIPALLDELEKMKAVSTVIVRG